MLGVKLCEITSAELEEEEKEGELYCAILSGRRNWRVQLITLPYQLWNTIYCDSVEADFQFGGVFIFSPE